MFHTSSSPPHPCCESVILVTGQMINHLLILDWGASSKCMYILQSASSWSFFEMLPILPYNAEMEIHRISTYGPIYWTPFATLSQNMLTRHAVIKQQNYTSRHIPTWMNIVLYIVFAMHLLGCKGSNDKLLSYSWSPDWSAYCIFKEYRVLQQSAPRKSLSVEISHIYLFCLVKIIPRY